MMTVLMTIQILCTLASLVYIIYILTNENSRRHSLLTAAVMSSFAGSLGYIMTLLCNNSDAALAVTSFGIMGAAFSHYLIYSFCMDHCGIKRVNVLSMILLAENIIGIAMALLTGKTGLFYKSFTRCDCDIFFVPKVEYGMGAYILIRCNDRAVGGNCGCGGVCFQKAGHTQRQAYARDVCGGASSGGGKGGGRNGYA